MLNNFLKSSIIEKIIILSKGIENIAEKSVLEKSGVSISGFEIMHIINEAGQVNPSDLCNCLSSGKSNISQRLAFLEKRGLVEKTPDTVAGDRRRQVIRLTAKGKDLFVKLETSLNIRIKKFEKEIGLLEIKKHGCFLNKIFMVLIKELEKTCPQHHCPQKHFKQAKKKISLGLLLIMAFSLAGCANKDAVETERPAIAVTARSIALSRQIDQTVEYPALVYPEEEALIVAKADGTASGVNFKLGDKVNAGDQLVKIDDAAKNNPGGNYSFNTNQVKQAQLVVEQAYTSLVMARTNYQTLVNTSEKDLRQAEIAKEQAAKGLSNVDLVATESYKTAELAYESAKLATEQAKINLESRQKQVGLSDSDTNDNSSLAADAAAVSCNAVITGLNNYLALDDDSLVDLAYKDDLGVRDSAVINRAKNAYLLAKRENVAYQSAAFKDEAERVQAAISLASKTKSLADAAEVLLEKTVSSNNLPQSSLIGVSLNSLLSAASGYQAQASAALSQANSAKQALENGNLNNNSSLALLEKTYDLAKKQEESALQNLNNAKAGNASQQDQAGFGSQSAGVQYESAKIKINSQLSIAKSQLDMSEIQYRNAVVALQGLYDNHLVVAPISGVITRKEVDNGSTISLGQTLASVSKTDQVKIQFFADEDSLKYLSVGQAVELSDNDGNKAPGKIYNLTPQADAMTKRFLVEVRPDSATSSARFIAGTVVNVSVVLKKTAQDDQTILLPLAALEITQNGNYVFLIDSGKAKRTKVEIVKIDGELAEIALAAAPDALVIIDGNKLVRDGDPVKNQ